MDHMSISRDNTATSITSLGLSKRRSFVRDHDDYYTTWHQLRFFSALSSTISIIPAALSYEYSYSQSRSYDSCQIIQEKTYAWRLLIIFFSYLAIILELLYKYFLFKWENIYPYTFTELPPAKSKTILQVFLLLRPRNLSDYLLTNHTWLVILMNLIFPYPGLNIQISIPQTIQYTRYEVCYYLEEFLYFIMFVRIFFLIFTICSFSRLQSPISRRICEKYSIDISATFSFRCYATTNPVSVLFFLLVIPGTLIFGIGIRVFERPLGLQDFESFENSIWLVLITMTSIGYGDYYPSSLCGRGIACLAIFLGGVSLSLTFFTIRSFLTLSGSEVHAYRATLSNREAGNLIVDRIFKNKEEKPGVFSRFKKRILSFIREPVTLNAERNLKFRRYEQIMKNLDKSLLKADDLCYKLVKIRFALLPRRGLLRSLTL